MQVQTLELHAVECPTPASSHHLVESLCSMPNLTNLTLSLKINDELCFALKAKASSVQVQTLNLEGPQCSTLVESLCSMPNLTDLTLMDLNQEVYSTLSAKASSIQVKTVKLGFFVRPSPASSHHLAKALCSMPNLTDLTLVGGNLTEELYSSLRAKAPSIQIRKGNCRLNEVAQVVWNAYSYSEWFNDVDCPSDSVNLDNSNDSDNSANLGNSSDSDDSADSFCTCLMQKMFCGKCF